MLITIKLKAMVKYLSQEEMKRLTPSQIKRYELSIRWNSHPQIEKYWVDENGFIIIKTYRYYSQIGRRGGETHLRFTEEYLKEVKNK
tara:strand:- start:10223 stop:10483 length:261 start_codon:yes stop_codon:yes gene_type:complete